MSTTPEQRARAWYPNAAWGGGNNKAVFDGVGGRFLWKPVSDSTKKCAVHTPAGVRIASLTVAGKTYGVGSIGNGYRPLFRLDKPGSAYGAQVPVQMNLHGGGVITVLVPNGGQRFEKSGFKDTDSGPVAPPVPPPPSVKPPAASITFPAKWVPYIEGVYIVEGVNAQGQAKAAHLCAKVNGNSFGTGRNLATYQQPAFYAVDVVDRIEHLIPHSVRGWIYVNAQGQIVQFGAQPLPPAVPVKPPVPAPVAPTPAPEPLHSRTPNSLTLRADFAAVVRKVDALANVIEPGNPKPIFITATRNGNTWTIPQALSAYPNGNSPNTWRISLNGTPPAGVTWHTSIKQSFLREGDANTYPPTTRA